MARRYDIPADSPHVRLVDGRGGGAARHSARGGRGGAGSRPRARGRDGDGRRTAADRRRSARTGRRGQARGAAAPARRQAHDDRRVDARDDRHVDALDGLRALAIASVVLYHLDVAWLPSGHMGVVLFLVLGGFFVTASARRALEGGAAGLPGLWLRRLGRVWPAMAAMVAVVTALCVLCNHLLLTKLRPDLLPSLLLANNVGQILRGASYFDQIGGPSPLAHLWYLGVDAQFCLAWTVLLALLPQGEGRVARVLALVGAGASAVLMALLYHPDVDPTRVYYGTDTRAFAPLLGAWLALAWPLGERPRTAGPLGLFAGGVRTELAGMGALACLALVMALVPDTSPLLYRGGMLLVSALACVLMAALRVPGPLATAFSAPPLRWLASRSYGLYLWHYPIFLLLSVNAATTPWWVRPLAVALSLLAAQVSWLLFDNGALLRLLGSAGGGGPLADALRSPRLAVPLALLVAVLGVDGVGLAVVGDVAAAPEDAITSTGAGAAEAMDLGERTGDQAPAADGDAEGALVDLDHLPSGSIVLRESASARASGLYDPVLIGDSVPGAAHDYFYEHCPDGLIDSYVGRRPDQMEIVLNDYLSQGVVGNVVILQAFSNNVPTTDEIGRMITACGPERKIYLVTVRIPQASQETINATIAQCVKLYGNATLIDWNELSADNMDKLYEDGTHLRPEGVSLYINMITNAIKRDFAEAGGSVLSEEEAQEASEGTEPDAQGGGEPSGGDA